MASELGGVIGRSSRPTCFILGAGCSISSGAPDSNLVYRALLEATSARLEGLDLRDVLHKIPEQEKQDILAPLFRRVQPSSGYVALAALAKYRPVTVLNLNWDKALAEACRRAGTLRAVRDVRQLVKDPPQAGGEGLVDIHVHGIIGEECRYGRVETLDFTDDEKSWLLANGLANTTVIAGATLTYETDLTRLFGGWAETVGPGGRPNASQWIFLRTKDDESAEDRLRQTNIHAQPLTYVRAPDIDFDRLAIRLVDRSLGIILASASDK